MDLTSESRIILNKDDDGRQEPSLHDSSMMEQEKEHSLVPTSGISELYHVEEDPAKPPLQVPVYLFANTSIEEVGSKMAVSSIQSHAMMSEATSMLFSSDDVKVHMIQAISDQMENSQDVEETSMLTESEIALPEFLNSIEQGSQSKDELDHGDHHTHQHLIPMIRQPNNERNIQEENVSEAMLQQFVESQSMVQQSGSIEVSQDNAAMSSQEKEYEESPHQVIIFADENCSERSNSVVSHKSDLENSIVQDENENYGEKLAEECNFETGDVSGEKSSEDVSKHDTNVEKTIPLQMAFEVMAEYANTNGDILKREVTTQTRPTRKQRAPRKRKHKATATSNDFDDMFSKLPLLDTEADEEVQSKQIQLTSSRQKRYKCPKCNLRFPTEERVNVHVRCHQDSSKDYKCYYCDYVTIQWVKMYRHLFQHGVEKPHKCTVCSFSCVNHSDLSAHMAVHSKTKDWECNKCRRAFKHRRNMVAHQRKCHGLDETGKPVQKQEGEEKFICEVCQKQLSNKKNLEKHVEIHLDIKPFVCDQCGHSTRLKESLVMHKRLHTGEKPYKCNLCKYATPDKSSLRRHKRIHNNDKPYKCEFCSYRCIQKHCLDTHVRRKHTGEQFVCGLCHYATHDRYGLNQHFKRHQSTNGVYLVGDDSSGDKTNATTVSTASPTTTLVSLPSGAVLASTTIGKTTLIADASQMPNVNQVLLHLPNAVAETDPNKNEDSSVENDVTEEAGDNGNEETIDITRLEANILQQLQQPGDEVYLQSNGGIVIQKQNGHFIVIEQQDDEDMNVTTANQTDTQEYLTVEARGRASDTMLGESKDRQQCSMGSLENNDNSSVAIMDIGNKLSTVEVIDTS